MSVVDKEWDELRRQYAPKNQTPEEFKASFQGDLEKAKTQTKHMRSWNDIESTEALKIERNQLVDNANVALSKSDYDEVSKMEDQIYEITEQIKDKDYFYQFARTRATKLQNQIDNFVLDPSVKGHTQADLDDLKRQLKEATEAMDVKDTSNYSTYDRNMTKMFKDAEKTKASIRDDLHTAQNKWQERTGGVGNFVESDEATSFFGKYGADVVEKAKGVNQWDIAEKFRLKNVDNVSQERVVAYNAVLDENPSLEAKLHRKEWSRLTESEKRDVLQAVADKYAEKLGTPRAKIVVEQKGNNGVLGSQLGDRITFNLEYIDSGIDKLSDTLVHEYSHLIDELSPNAGALGSQYAHYAGKIYSNKAEEGYRVALTEQSSYKIGKAVADAVAPRKMANPFSDGISYLYKFDGVFDAKGGVTSADLSGLMNGEQGFVYLSDIDAIADNVDEIYGTLKNQGMTIRSFTQNGTDFYMIGTKGYFDKLLN